jgi:pSer/pThr/pTyr-binding forkhead associated (FHA) protein
MRVQAVLSDPVIEQTTQIQERPDVAAAALSALQALDAYLIIGGRRHVALDQPVLSLGRRRDNDVVLDSPSVSRQHAQIRWRYGRFVLYDLSRRGRTAVNNQPVSEHVLQSGDVIALSDTLIVYGENQDPRHRADTTLDEGEQTRQMPKV